MARFGWRSRRNPLWPWVRGIGAGILTASVVAAWRRSRAERARLRAAIVPPAFEAMTSASPV